MRLKSSFEKRLANVESKMHWLHADVLFEEWIQEHYPSGVANYWEILPLVPLSLRIECYRRIFEAMENGS